MGPAREVQSVIQDDQVRVSLAYYHGHGLGQPRSFRWNCLLLFLPRHSHFLSSCWPLFTTLALTIKPTPIAYTFFVDGGSSFATAVMFWWRLGNSPPLPLPEFCRILPLVPLRNDEQKVCNRQKYRLARPLCVQLMVLSLADILFLCFLCFFETYPLLAIEVGICHADRSIDMS